MLIRGVPGGSKEGIKVKIKMKARKCPTVALADSDGVMKSLKIPTPSKSLPSCSSNVAGGATRCHLRPIGVAKKPLARQRSLGALHSD